MLAKLRFFNVDHCNQRPHGSTLALTDTRRSNQQHACWPSCVLDVDHCNQRPHGMCVLAKLRFLTLSPGAGFFYKSSLWTIKKSPVFFYKSSLWTNKLYQNVGLGESNLMHLFSCELHISIKSYEGLSKNVKFCASSKDGQIGPPPSSFPTRLLAHIN